MNKLLIVLVLLNISFTALQAQTAKQKIGFIPFTDPEQSEIEYRELAYKNIYAAALRIFTNTQRFDVLDRGAFNIIKIEKEFQKGEDFANVEIIEQGKTAAAELLAVAQLSTFTITESDDGNGYSVYITAEYKQIDVKTGKAVDAFQLIAEAIDKQTGINNKRLKTIEEAISKAVKEMEIDLENWIRTYFPMIIEVIDIEENNQYIIVNGGFGTGLSKGVKLKAVLLKPQSNGRNISQTIAKLDYTNEGIGEDMTYLKMASKKAWPHFLDKWKDQQYKIYVTEDL